MDDPLLSFRECAADLGVHSATWRRNVLPVIETIQISARRRGVRRSVHEAYKASRTRPAARQVDSAGQK